MDRVVEYIPNVLVATVMVVVGLLVAGFLRGVIATSADRVGMSYAEHLANGCYYIMSLMVFMAAFAQLKIEFDLLNYAILIVFGGVGSGLRPGVRIGRPRRDGRDFGRLLCAAAAAGRRSRDRRTLGRNGSRSWSDLDDYRDGRRRNVEPPQRAEL